jgi:hypothetical protein
MVQSLGIFRNQLKTSLLSAADVKANPNVSTHRLESALRVGEPCAEHATEQQVVAAGDEFALRPAHHARRRGQPRTDGNVGVT